MGHWRDGLRDILIFPTMKSQGAAKNEANNVAQAKTVSEKPVEKIDFSKVEIEPLFKDEVDFETFSKSGLNVFLNSTLQE